jgi:3-deoxy-D-manno-octulosonic-acid transferase
MYKKLMAQAEPLLTRLLARRLARGKEDAARLPERMGTPSRPRPEGCLIWIHAASVGEAQSALILVDRLKRETDAAVLLTTGTRTSADLMARRLPAGCFHQYIPLDHPKWVDRFLNHWRPDLALWMESELWPNLLGGIATRGIPAVLVNARLSAKSYRHWRLLGSAAGDMLRVFSLILAQTDGDAKRFRKLGAGNILVTDNIKYSAAPLPVDDAALSAFPASRPLWVYASTHAGEESMACRLHEKLKPKVPGLLTVIIPRHPERRDEVAAEIEKHRLSFTRRGAEHTLPRDTDDVYLVDTMGELGTFIN